MTLKIPFIYLAKVIKPKGRNITNVLIEDSIDINIAEYNNLPIAFKVDDVSYYWNNETLWKIALADKGNNIVTLDELKNNTENPLENFNPYDIETPFYSFSKFCSNNKYINTKPTIIYSSKDEAIKQNKQYIEDSRDSTIKEIKSLAETIIIFKGIMCKKTSEPTYCVINHGFGGIHGEVKIVIDTDFNYKTSYGMSSYYSALEYDLAYKVANEFATERKHTESLKNLMETKKIEILIPEAVKIDMTKNLNLINIYDLTPHDLLNMTNEDFINVIEKKYFERFNRDIKVLNYMAKFNNSGIEITIIDSKRVS